VAVAGAWSVARVRIFLGRELCSTDSLKQKWVSGWAGGFSTESLVFGGFLHREALGRGVVVLLFAWIFVLSLVGVFFIPLAIPTTS